MHALSVTGAALSYSLSLDLLTRSDSVPCPMAVPCGHACGSALRQSGGEIISTPSSRAVGDKCVEVTDEAMGDGPLTLSPNSRERLESPDPGARSGRCGEFSGRGQ